jgi:hypothetical protein
MDKPYSHGVELLEACIVVRRSLEAFVMTRKIEEGHPDIAMLDKVIRAATPDGARPAIPERLPNWQALHEAD